MTKFKILYTACGLSNSEAAELLNVRIDTVKSWSSGRNRAPAGVIRELINLTQRIQLSAEKAVEQILSITGESDTIVLGLAINDEKAQTLGLPTAACQAALLGRVISMLPDDLADRVRIVHLTGE